MFKAISLSHRHFRTLYYYLVYKKERLIVAVLYRVQDTSSIFLPCLSLEQSSSLIASTATFGVANCNFLASLNVMQSVSHAPNLLGHVIWAAIGSLVIIHNASIFA